MSNEFQPPRNAVQELFEAVPASFHSVMLTEVKKIDQLSFGNHIPESKPKLALRIGKIAFGKRLTAEEAIKKIYDLDPWKPRAMTWKKVQNGQKSDEENEGRERTRERDDYMWPSVPYHYGMGRIKEYEAWRDSLSEEEQRREILESRRRNERYYNNIADLLIVRMHELNHDLMRYLSVEQKRSLIVHQVFNKDFTRPCDKDRSKMAVRDRCREHSLER